MIDFPITEMLDEGLCLIWLERQFHPDGMKCPHCGANERRIARQNVHYPSYRCLQCDRYYSLFTGTIFQKTRQAPSQIVLLLRGVAQGESTNRLSRELGICYRQVLTLRQRIQENLYEKRATNILTQEHEIEVDELYQNAGKKRYPTHRPVRSAQTARKQASRPRNV